MSRSTRALLASFALHAAALAVFVGIRPDPWLADEAQPLRVRVHAARDLERDGADGGGDRLDPAAPAQPSASAANRHGTERSTSEPSAGGAGRPAPSSAAVPDTSPAASVSGGAREGVSAAAPADVARFSRPLSKPALPAGLRASSAVLSGDARAGVPREPVEPSLAAAPAISVTPAPIRPAIPEPELRALEERSTAWARDLAALDDVESWTHEGKRYTARLERVPSDDAMALEEVVVTVTRVDGGKRLSTEIRMRRLAFSSFAQLVDRWDPRVQIHDDEIDGRFHSNSEIRLSNSGGVQPVFRGPVTTARGIDTSYSDRRIRRDEVFLGGLETRAGRIGLPKELAPFAEAADVDDTQVQLFERDTRITFYADGTYGWRDLEAPEDAGRRSLAAEPRYLVGAEGVALHVAGVVDGRVLVYSPEEIVVEGDLTQAAAPDSSEDADDYVGLVSAGAVEIAEPGVTGPGDLHVHAAIFAGRRFAIRRYTRREQATLHVLGSITAGSLSATEPRYRTRLRFDPRLERLRPPGFPVTDRYAIHEWDRRWTVEPIAREDPTRQESAPF